MGGLMHLRRGNPHSNNFHSLEKSFAKHHNRGIHGSEPGVRVRHLVS